MADNCERGQWLVDELVHRLRLDVLCGFVPGNVLQGSRGAGTIGSGADGSG